MSEGNRKAFLEWYNDRVRENYVFDFKKELREYCRSDVDNLRRSMLKFRENFLKLENIDPLQYVTIAVYKDVTNAETYSQMSISWLDYLAKKEKVEIQHALNGGEFVIEEIGRGGAASCTDVPSVIPVT